MRMRDGLGAIRFPRPFRTHAPVRGSRESLGSNKIYTAA